jgi:glycosyltransferase involved in cell wall biosynthesis
MAEWSVVDCVHCIDTDLMQQKKDELLPKKPELRAEAGIPPDAVVLIFSGKLAPRKNPLLLARALSLVKERERVWVLVAGDGALRSEFETALKKVIGDRAVFLGFVNQSELGRYYVISDVLVLSSSWGETWGLVVNEAMLFGLPALVTDTVGCREDLVIPGRTGYIYPCDNEEALASIIQDLIDNPRLIQKLGTAAQEHIKAYSADAAVEGIVEALRRLNVLK